VGNARTGRSVALVMGGGRGIGAALAESFAAANFDVVVNDIGCAVDGSSSSPAVAAGLAEALRPYGVEVIGDASDAADCAAVAALRDRLAARQISVDVLANAAGFIRPRAVHNISLEDWNATLAIHGASPGIAMDVFLPDMVAAGYGRVINFTSCAGLFPTFGSVSYATGKAAAAAMTRSAGSRLRGTGVTANAIAPHAETRMFVVTNARADDSNRLSPDRIDAKMHRLPFPGEWTTTRVADFGVALAHAPEINGELFLVGGDQVSLLRPAEPELLVKNTSSWDQELILRYILFMTQRS